MGTNTHALTITSHLIVCLFALLLPNRPPTSVGGPSGAFRSKSYHHMAFNPPSCCSTNIHSDPLYRKTLCSIHPVDAAGIIAAPNYAGRCPHTTRYVIVNERKPRKKLLRSSARIPRHYLMEEPAEIVELYPRNIKCYAPRNPHRQPHHHHSYPSQPHLSEEEEDEVKSQQRMILEKNNRPHSLSDLQQPAHFFIGDHVECCTSKDTNAAERWYRTQEDDEEDGDGEMYWGDLKSHSRSQVNIRGADPFLGQTRRRIPSPAGPRRSPARNRRMESSVKLKTRAELETPLSESDSASLASSSDQQNSSTDQYIQVIHNKEHCLSDIRQGTLSNSKSQASFDSKMADANDLVCSKV